MAGEGFDADTVGSVGPVDTVGDVVGGGLIHKARHRLVVESPELRRDQLVVTGVEHIRPVALPNEKQRPVDRHHRIEKHGDIHCPRLGHAVVTRPLRRTAAQRLDQARMPRQQTEHLAEGMRGKRGPRCPVFSRQTSWWFWLRTFAASARNSAISSSVWPCGMGVSAAHGGLIALTDRIDRIS